MLQKLDLTKAHISLIKRVCDLEHSSLIRCHEKTEDEIDRRADELNCDYITLREFHHELSNAFYEFQVLYEEPENLLGMEPYYFNLFTRMVEIYENTLSSEYPDIYPDFRERIITHNHLKLTRENPTFLN